MCVRTHRVILRCFRYRMFPEPAGGYVVATRWCIFTRAIPEITESRWKEEDGKGFVYFPLFSLFLFFFFHFSPVHFLIQPFRPQVERFAVHTITPPPLASCTKIFIVPDQVTHGYRTTWKVNEPRVYKDFAVSFFFFFFFSPLRDGIVCLANKSTRNKSKNRVLSPWWYEILPVGGPGLATI